MTRVFPGVMFTTGLYSLLIWAYVVARVVLNDINLANPFIDGINVSFWELGVTAFAVGIACFALAAIAAECKEPSDSLEGGRTSSL